MFTGGVSVPACSTGDMTKGVSVKGVSVHVQGVSVQGEVSVWRVSVQGSLSGGVSVWGVCPGGLCPRGPCQGDPWIETPRTVTSGRYASYLNLISFIVLTATKGSMSLSTCIVSKVIAMCCIARSRNYHLSHLINIVGRKYCVNKS